MPIVHVLRVLIPALLPLPFGLRLIAGLVILLLLLLSLVLPRPRMATVPSLLSVIAMTGGGFLSSCVLPWEAPRESGGGVGGGGGHTQNRSL